MLKSYNENSIRLLDVIHEHNKKGLAGIDKEELIHLLESNGALDEIGNNEVAENIGGLKNLVFGVFGEQKGKQLLAEGLKKSPLIFFECFNKHQEWKMEECEHLKTFAREVAGEQSGAIIKGFLSSSDSFGRQTMWNIAVGKNDLAMLEYLVASIRDISSEYENGANEKLKEIFSKPEESGFKNIMTSGHQGNVGFIEAYLDIARSVCGPEQAEKFIKSIFQNVAHSLKYYNIEWLNELAGNPDTHPGLRRYLFEAESKGVQQASEIAGNLAKGVYGDFKIPDIDDVGNQGEFYKYGAMIDCIHKLQIVADGNAVDYPKIISRHIRNNTSVISGSNVNWAGLAKCMEGVSKKDLSQAADSVREVSRLVALHVIAAKYPDTFDDQKVKLDNRIKPLAEEIFKYMVEEKSVPQLVKISERWHKVRWDFLKTGENGSTLRDFARESAWGIVANEKEIPVSLQGLESYKVVEYMTSQELDADGIALKHCASGYVDLCESGKYHIFSIRKGDQRVSTLGVDSRGDCFRLDQNLVHENEEPSADVKKIGEWFVEGLNSQKLGGHLWARGKIDFDATKTLLEDKLGISRENATPERLNANLKAIFGMVRGTVYPFGQENKNADVDQFLSNMKSASEEGKARSDQQGFASRITKSSSAVRQ